MGGALVLVLMSPHGQCMNAGCHYNVITLGCENELLHMCIDMLHVYWLEIINIPKIL